MTVVTAKIISQSLNFSDIIKLYCPNQNQIVYIENVSKTNTSPKR